MIVHYALRESIAPVVTLCSGAAVVVADQVGSGGSDYTIIGVLVGVLGAVWKLLNVIGTRMAKSIEDTGAEVRTLVAEMRATNERHARTHEEIATRLSTIESNTRKQP